MHCDPIEEERRRPKGEAKEGLLLRRHPLTLLALETEARALVVDLFDGDLGSRPLTFLELEQRSNCEVELVHLWRGASGRRRIREIRKS